MREVDFQMARSGHRLRYERTLPPELYTPNRLAMVQVVVQPPYPNSRWLGRSIRRQTVWQYQPLIGGCFALTKRLLAMAHFLHHQKACILAVANVKGHDLALQ